MIRCVRNEIPESKMEAGAISSPTYQGTEKGVKAYFGIKSNVPYWTATLVTGEGAGTAEPTDFSFASAPSYIRPTEAIRKISLYTSNVKKVLHRVHSE